MASGNIESLLQNGIEAARAGNSKAAKDLFVQALKLDPGNEMGWMWMVQVVDSDQERKFCLNKILEINPNNPNAQQMLASLEAPALPDWMQASSTPPPQPAPSPPPPTPTDEPALDLPTTGELGFDLEEDWLAGLGADDAPSDDPFDGAWPAELAPAAPDPFAGAEPPGASPAPAPGIGVEDATGDALGLAWDDAPGDWPSAPADDSADVGAWPEETEESGWGWDKPGIEEDEATDLDGLEFDDPDDEAAGKKDKKKAKRKPRRLRSCLVFLITVAAVLAAVIVVVKGFLLPQFYPSSAPAPAPATESGNTHEGPNYSFEYPAGWVVESAEGDETISAVELARGSADVPRDYASATITTRPAGGQTAEASIEAWRGEMSDAEERDQGVITIGGNEGQFILFAAVSEGTSTDETETTEAEESAAEESSPEDTAEELEETEEPEESTPEEVAETEPAPLTTYTYAAAVVVDEQMLTFRLETTNEADIEAGKQMLASMTFGVPEAPLTETTPEGEIDDTGPPTSEATPPGDEGDTGPPTSEATPPGDEGDTGPPTSEATEVAMVEGQTYVGEGYTLVYPDTWGTIDIPQGDEDTIEVVLSRGQFEDGPLPEDFAFAVITTGSAGANAAADLVELLRPVAASQVAEWDNAEPVEAADITPIDLGPVLIDELGGAFDYYTIPRAEALAMYVYAAAVVYDEPRDLSFTLMVYTINDSARGTAEAMLSSVTFDEGEEVEVLDPEDYGPPAP